MLFVKRKKKKNDKISRDNGTESDQQTQKSTIINTERERGRKRKRDRNRESDIDREREVTKETRHT